MPLATELHWVSALCEILSPAEAIRPLLLTSLCTMANSPLILRGAAEINGAAKQSKLTSNAASSNGATPELAQTSNSGGRDVAEQMNEDEKSKYVKGNASVTHEE